jgi:hypothetical protein
MARTFKPPFCMTIASIQTNESGTAVEYTLRWKWWHPRAWITAVKAVFAARFGVEVDECP